MGFPLSRSPSLPTTSFSSFLINSHTNSSFPFVQNCLKCRCPVYVINISNMPLHPFTPCLKTPLRTGCPFSGLKCLKDRCVLDDVSFLNDVFADPFQCGLGSSLDRHFSMLVLSRIRMSQPCLRSVPCVMHSHSRRPASLPGQLQNAQWLRLEEFRSSTCAM